jgi:very-short-patch-repair endonuclease
VVDFLRAGKSLIVEVDGGQHQTAIEYDDWRTGILCGLGYRVLRFWNNQVFGELESVKETIHAKLLEGGTALTLALSQGERGTPSP